MVTQQLLRRCVAADSRQLVAGINASVHCLKIASSRQRLEDAQIQD
jgi:hypothetical protein